MFKENWEKTSATQQLTKGMVEKMVRLAYPGRKLYSFEVISGGCANLNFKIQLEDEEHPHILRVYLRDEDAVYREQKLGALLKQTIPVPLTYFIGEVDGYHFAITEFLPGILLRDLLLSDTPHDISAIMYDVGEVLSKIAIHEFPQAGFFDKDLNVIPHTSLEAYLIDFANDCLRHKTVISVLSPDIIDDIKKIFDKYGHLFPDESEKHLVHADFDPANILVNEINGAWKVSGILDWEFAFSGPVLCDVANMLRYAHKMPPEFQDAFLHGLTSGGISLPENWHITIQLLNLLALLDCLKRSDPKNKPNQCADILELVHSILTELNTVTQTKPTDILSQATTKHLKMTPCSDEKEWLSAKNFRNKYFFGPHNIEDPYTWTFNHTSHQHFVLYQGQEIIGYTHIQLWPDQRAAMRIIVIDETKRSNHFGGQFLALCEEWLKNQGYKSLHAESRASSLRFYKKNGYIEMPFNDPDGYESSDEDIAVGKVL